MKEYFDGYNNIIKHDRYESFSLVEYRADKWYCGDRSRLFAVRCGGEDVADFATLKDAEKYFDIVVGICKKCESENRMGDVMDEIFKAWKEVA